MGARWGDSTVGVMALLRAVVEVFAIAYLGERIGDWIVGVLTYCPSCGVFVFRTFIEVFGASLTRFEGRRLMVWA